MEGIQLRNVSKSFGPVGAVRNLSLEVRPGELMVVVGPSGCGKSTLLRLLAGLEEPDSGDLLIASQRVNGLSPAARNVAMVFQSYALYPNMTVYGNLAFSLKLRRRLTWAKRLLQPATTRRIRNEIDQQVRSTAGLLQIENLMHRLPAELSGGQRQRVALGRALVRQPRLFLLDEPLSNLDARLRVTTRAELIRLHRQLQITTIYVTHDQVEAMTMGQRIAVLKDGELQGCGAPLELYHHPPNRFVAEFLGSPAMNVLRLPVTPEGLGIGDHRLEVSEGIRNLLQAQGLSEVLAGWRPEDIQIAAAGIPLRVELVEPLGHATLVAGRIADNLVTLVQPGLVAEPALTPGALIQVQLPLARMHLFHPQNEQVLTGVS